MTSEYTNKPGSGYIYLIILALLIALTIYGLAGLQNPWFVILIPVIILISAGFFFIYPNGSRVLTLFGEYKGTVKAHGFFWVNPFYVKKSISLRARNFDSERLKVNDKMGNPLQV